MEPADPAQLSHKLGQQDAILESQQQQLLAVMQCVQTMTPQMATPLQSKPHRLSPLLGQLWLLLLRILGPPSIPLPQHLRSANPTYHHKRGTTDPPENVGAFLHSVSSLSASSPRPFPLMQREWCTSTPN